MRKPPDPLDAHGEAETLRRDFNHLLQEIEQEKVPERLLQLAMQLQAALAAKREREGRQTANEDS